MTDDEYPGGVLNIPIKPGEASSAQWREHFTKTVFRRLAKFKPDFMFTSAGFDAHIRDPLANISLESIDFYEITKKIVELANVHCEGRIIGLGGGGYNLDNIARAWTQVITAFLVNQKS